MGCVQNVLQQLRDFYAFLFTNVNFNENELVCKYIIQLINHLNIVFGFFLLPFFVSFSGCSTDSWNVHSCALLTPRVPNILFCFTP